eukprot:TRINITY_DN15092_c0_g2_i3.p1 TRINITY_DN15092_c0_g2~~TRINITY_DN15092_c0_g2_i3.p1  ORF type:complete len:329 (-),score=51.37 TRINITY_DN15092_c0_g2_i3:101-958(-)
MGMCYSCVPNSTVQLIESCGRFSRVATPGFNCVQCYCGEYVAGKLSLRVQQLDVTCETKTKDNVFVNVVVSVQYQVQDAVSAFYKLTDSRSQIKSYVFDVIRASVPKLDLDDVFNNKEDIATDVKESLVKSMGEFGFIIVQALVTDIDPAAKVKAAMNEINASRRLRVAAVEKAEAEKIAIVTAAEADAESKFLAGQGIARQRQAIVNGLRESVLEFSNDVGGVSSKEVIDMMMLTQYFDSLRDIGAHSKTNALFLPHQPGGVTDVTSQIRLGALQAQELQSMRR